VTRATTHVRIGSTMALLLAVGIVTLPSLCQASPPDPTWIAGLYDDADHDDVVLDVIGTVALPAPVPPQVTAPIRVDSALPTAAREAPSKRSVVGRVDRAPPPA
jgi:hypothetical protein